LPDFFIGGNVGPQRVSENLPIMPRYFVFHKPYQVMSQFSEASGKKTLADFFAGLPRDVYPVGRLDYDSEGLLLLTDDKALTHQLLDPVKGHPRTYLVQVDGAITTDAILKLQQGVTLSIDGKTVRSKKAGAQITHQPDWLAERDPPIRYRKEIPTSWILLTLTEGKNRQVRRMTAAVGFPTLRLVRVAIGGLQIDELQPGSYREYDAAIKKLLFPATQQSKR
jgi:23S rRNA pseudouridine2457 synthase